VTATPAPVSAVPRRMRIACAVVAVAVVVVMVVAGLLLRSPAPGQMVVYASDQFALGGLGVILGAGILALGRSRVDADLSGVRVRNIAGGRQVPWSSVREVRFARKAWWGGLLLANGDELPLFAIQVFDGERAAEAIEGLRALHAAARATEPPPPARPPLLYDD
jgi:Bacterial PH domain